MMVSDMRHLDPPVQARSLTNRGMGLEGRHRTPLGNQCYCILLTQHNKIALHPTKKKYK